MDMDTMFAFAMGEAHRNCERKVFDWDKAARLIKEKKPKCADAGLQEDWYWTADEIYRDGEIVEDGNPYLASTWATPVLTLDGEDFECYVMESSTEWGADTYWPESARRILTEGENGR